jgi:hypothetical protein
MRRPSPNPPIPPIPPIAPSPTTSRPQARTKKLRMQMHTVARSSPHPNPKKARPQRGGVCYRKQDCQGEVLGRGISKQECAARGGKSWKGSRGCQNI